MHCRIGCICMTFSQCDFSNVFSNCSSDQMHSRIGCICMTFIQCEFSNVFSNCLPEQIHCRIGRICTTFLQSEFSNVFSNYLSEQMRSRIVCIWKTYFQSEFSVVFKPTLRISYPVSIETPDLESFHSIEKFRVLNPQYRVLSLLKNCAFLSFLAKKVVF